MTKKILKFYANWCSPCKQLTQMLDGFDAYEIKPINADDAEDSFLEEFGVRGLPVLAVVNEDENGEYTLLDKMTGLVTKDQLKEFADSL